MQIVRACNPWLGVGSQLRAVWDTLKSCPSPCVVVSPSSTGELRCQSPLTLSLVWVPLVASAPIASIPLKSEKTYISTKTYLKLFCPPPSPREIHPPSYSKKP